MTHCSSVGSLGTFPFMKPALRQTRSYLTELFRRHGFHPRHALGQNFLIDLNIIDFVVTKGEICDRDVVLEVGAGTGGMTAFLAERAAEVVSVELDRNMHMFATEAVAGRDNVQILNIDALKNKNHFHPEVLAAVDEALAINSDRELKLIANLPYCIATPVITNLVATNLPWSRMVVTIQYELGLRMEAKPSRSQYGALAVWLQSQCDVTMLKKLPGSVFWPPPKVDSAVMLLTPNAERAAAISDRGFFHTFVRTVFQHRRKLLRGVLCTMYKQEMSKPEVDAMLAQFETLEQTGHAQTIAEKRAEQLDVATLVRLSNHVRSELNARGTG